MSPAIAKRPVSEAFDQIEPRGEACGELRIDAAGQRQHRDQHAEEQNERQRPDEIGHGEQDAVQAVDDRSRRRCAASACRQWRRRRRARPRRGAPGSQARASPAAARRARRARQTCSEIEVPKSPCDHAAEPDPELLGQRRVEAVVRAQRGDVGGARARRDHHRDRDRRARRAAGRRRRPRRRTA